MDMYILANGRRLHLVGDDDRVYRSKQGHFYLGSLVELIPDGSTTCDDDDMSELMIGVQGLDEGHQAALAVRFATHHRVYKATLNRKCPTCLDWLAKGGDPLWRGDRLKRPTARYFTRSQMESFVEEATTIDGWIGDKWGKTAVRFMRIDARPAYPKGTRQ